MSYFPFFMDIEGQTALIIGGGKVALDKARRLLPYGVMLRVIAPEFAEGFSDLGEQVTLVKRAFEETDLDGSNELPMFVICAAGVREVNKQAAFLCRKQRIPVNTVDDIELCSFIFPCLVKRGPLSAGISTSGASPAAAQVLKRQFSEMLPENVEEILIQLSRERAAAKENIKDPLDRKEYLSRLAEEALAERGNSYDE